MSVIDATGDSVMASVPVGFHQFADVCWNRQENKVYVAGRYDESLAVIDCTADTIEKNMRVSTGIACLYNDSVCNKVYGLDVNNQYLRVIQAATDTFCASLYAGYATAVLDNRKQGPANRLYSTDLRTGRVTVVEGYKLDSVISRITVGQQPVALAWNPLHSRVYVSNSGSSSISVIRDTIGVGVEEGQLQVSSPKQQATVVRGMLFLPTATSPKPQAASLLDVSGRKVMNLRPGANDVRALAPGVYFVRETPAQAQGKAVHKIIITR